MRSARLDPDVCRLEPLVHRLRNRALPPIVLTLHLTRPCLHVVDRLDHALRGDAPSELAGAKRPLDHPALLVV